MKDRDIEKAALVKKAARIVGVSERQVRRVLAGDSENETVVTTVVTMQEMETEMENLLLKAVRELVPF